MSISGGNMTNSTMTLSTVTAINNTVGGVPHMALSVLCGGLGSWWLWYGHVNGGWTLWERLGLCPE